MQKQPTGTVIAYYENAYQAHAISLLTEAGKIEEWSCLYTLWTKESNWNPKSLNKKSGAFGIAQFMPVTWEQVGYKKLMTGLPKLRLGLHISKENMVAIYVRRSEVIWEGVGIKT